MSSGEWLGRMSTKTWGVVNISVQRGEYRAGPSDLKWWVAVSDDRFGKGGAALASTFASEEDAKRATKEFMEASGKGFEPVVALSPMRAGRGEYYGGCWAWRNGEWVAVKRAVRSPC